MNEVRFVQEREPAWRDLAALVAKARGGAVSRLTGEELRRLAAGYRAACADLATARTLGVSPDVEQRVNDLCSVAHGILYSEGRARGPNRLVQMLAHEFPAAVRSSLRFHVASTLAAVVAAVAAYVLLRTHPDLADQAFGSTFRERAERAASQPDGARRYVEVSGMFGPLLAYGLMVNNIVVSLLAFGAGAAGVVPAVLVLVFNGIVLGAGFAVFADRGVPEVLFNFVIAHGPIELLAIFLAAGAGMHVGASWIVPGRRARGPSFTASARSGLSILLGTTFLLVCAGLIEGNLSPSAAPLAVKLATGVVTFALTILWLMFGGRGLAAPSASPASPAAPPASA